MKEHERKKRKNSMQLLPEQQQAFSASAACSTNAAAAPAASNAASSSTTTATATAGSSSHDSFIWPRQAAERVRLLVPDEYKTAQEKQQQKQHDDEEQLYCHLHYDASRHVLLVVMTSSNSENNDNDEMKEMMILDIISPNDLIGADISLELAAPTEAAAAGETTPTEDIISPRAARSKSSNANDSSSSMDEDDQHTANDNGRRAANEPPSDSLHDHRGHAVLSLYVYPRQDPSTCTTSSWLYRLLGLSSHFDCSPPLPPPRQSLTAFLNQPQQQQQQQHDKEQQQQQQQQQYDSLLLHGQPRFAHFRKFQLAPAEDLSGSSTLLAAIRQLAKPKPSATTTTRPSSTAPTSTTTMRPKDNHETNNNNTDDDDKKYLVIVNPHSGPKKNAAMICQTVVLPMLQQTVGVVETKLVTTTHPRHAQELMCRRSTVNCNSNHNHNNGNTAVQKDNGDHHHHHDDDDDEAINILDYNGIILMGGDGIMHEVLNGIMQRPDAHDVLQNITLGIVGCGSCNGLAATIAHASREAIGNVVNQVFVIAKGYQGVRMDISRYQTVSSSSTTTTTAAYYSFLTFAYGLIADIDIESELLHWLGEVRIDIWAVWRVLFSLRRYRARFSYLPPCASGNSTALLPDDILPTSVTDPLPTTSGKDDKDNYGWKTLSCNDDDDDDYNSGIILFWASQVSHAAEHTHQAPDSQLQDGVFKVMLIRNTKTITRWQVARILLALASGTHVNLAGVEFIDCVAYRLEPLVGNDKKKNNNNNKQDLNVLDGEVIESGPIQAQVLPSMVRIFCNPPAHAPL